MPVIQRPGCPPAGARQPTAGAVPLPPARGGPDRLPPIHPVRASGRVQLVCVVCGSILIGLTPERAAVHQQAHQTATGHLVRMEPLAGER
jgi:hypothetical protein